MRFTVVINILALGILAFFFLSVIFSGKFDGEPAVQHQAGPRPDELPARTGSAGSSPPFPSPSGSISRSRSCRSPPEESHRPETRRPARDHLGAHHARSLRCADARPQPRGGRRAAKIGVSATPLFDGFKGVFGAGTAADPARPDRPGGTDRQLLHDHLRLRAEHVLAVAGRLLPQVAVAHRPQAQDSPRRPHRGRDRRVRPRGADLRAGKASGFLAGQIVGALLYMAVFGAVISYAMQCLSFILLADAGCRTSSGPTGACVGIPGPRSPSIIAVVALISLYSNSELPARGVRDADLLPGRHRVLRHRRAAPPGALAGRGVRPHAQASTGTRRPKGTAPRTSRTFPSVSRWLSRPMSPTRHRHEVTPAHLRRMTLPMSGPGTL